jgi:hypothetical protein
MPRTHVSVDDIATAFAVVEKLMRAERMGPWHVDDEVLYWEVLYSEQFNMTESPKLAVGDVADDVSFLREEGMEVATGMFLAKLSAVLRFVASKIDEVEA